LKKWKPTGKLIDAKTEEIIKKEENNMDVTNDYLQRLNDFT
jgi:hypothetical protein